MPIQRVLSPSHLIVSLVFMGSEKYPYKGVLDQLANRAFSAGTNAWTDTDHTAYTLATAGSQGFLQMLPIYIDHILYPTLRPNGFVTEVRVGSNLPFRNVY
jgi:Zn-dependent M16 (insulinase) family peptidase